MFSEKAHLMGIYKGFVINADKNKKSYANAVEDNFVHPLNTGDLKK